MQLSAPGRSFVLLLKCATLGNVSCVLTWNCLRRRRSSDAALSADCTKLSAYGIVECVAPHNPTSLARYPTNRSLWNIARLLLLCARCASYPDMQRESEKASASSAEALRKKFERRLYIAVAFTIGCESFQLVHIDILRDRHFFSPTAFQVITIMQLRDKLV